MSNTPQNGTLGRRVNATRDDVDYLRSNRIAQHLDRMTALLLQVHPEHPEQMFEQFYSILKVGNVENATTAFSQSVPALPGSPLSSGANNASLGRLTTAPVGVSDDRGLPHTPLLHERFPIAPKSDVKVPQEVLPQSAVGVKPYTLEKRPGAQMQLHGPQEWITDALTKYIDDAVAASSNFDNSYPAKCNGNAYSLQNAVHWRLRLGSLFLHLIGRDRRSENPVISGKGHYEYEKASDEENAGVLGLPEVRLLDRLRHQAPGKPLVISSENVQNLVNRKYGAGEVRRLLKDWTGRADIDGNPAEGPLGLDKVSDVFGTGEFEISMQEVQELERSVRIYTAYNLPSRFFLHLVNIVSRNDVLQWYKDRKALPLSWFEQLPTPCEVGSLLHRLKSSEQERKEMGFTSIDHLKSTLSQSLTELSTQVCVAQFGYFFVGNDNQIAPKTPLPIALLSCPGIDFNAGSAARVEMGKYFSRQGFLPGGAESLKARVKVTYDLLFTACKEYGVTHPTAIAMGLGIFLPKLSEEVQNEVKVLYHRAQFELLCDNDYGFDTFFLNPGPGTGAARSLLDKENYNFKCRVCLFWKDAKSFCLQLARLGYRTSFLNPSDCIAVLQGCMGYWWEVGHGERYVGEEDFAASSTGLLARAYVCTLWSAIDDMTEEEEIKRIVHIPNAGGDTSRKDMLNNLGSLFELAHPIPIKALPNPEKNLHSKIKRILWADTAKNHRLHLRPMINDLRSQGIIVDEVMGTAEMRRLLEDRSGPSYNFVITSLFSKRVVTPDGKRVVLDTGHRLVHHAQQLRLQHHYIYRIIVASMHAINSQERSTLYSEGTNLVAFNFHKKHHTEMVNELLRVQVESDRLCDVIITPPHHHSAEGRTRTERAQELLGMGIDVNFAPKAWSPIHFCAADIELMETEPEILDLLIKYEAEVDRRTQMSTGNVFKGSTALMIAVEYHNVKAVQTLLKYGASPNTKTCLDFGVEEKEHTFTALSMSKAKVERYQNFNQSGAAPMSMRESISPPLDVCLSCNAPNSATPTPAQSAATISLAEYLSRSSQILKLLEEKTNVAPSDSPIPKLHPMLSVLWISTSSRLSLRTCHIRNRLDSMGAVTLQTLCYNEEFSIEQSLSSWRLTLDRWLHNCGSRPDAFSAVDQLPMLWLQCVVIELNRAERLPLWVQTVNFIKNEVIKHRGTDKDEGKKWEQAAPWLRIITYAEGFSARPFEDELAQEPFLVKVPTNSMQHSLAPLAGIATSEVLLNSKAASNGEVIIAESTDKQEAQTDPSLPKCSPGIQSLHSTVMQSITHWAWDGDDSDASYPDRAYNAEQSYAIEQAYRAGAPKFPLEPRAVYFKDMVQRVIKQPMRMRLCFRYPEPCFNADEVVLTHPHLLKEINEGNCLSFIGAGFCVPAGGPSWADLLRGIADIASAKEKDRLKELEEAREARAASGVETPVEAARRASGMENKTEDSGVISLSARTSIDKRPAYGPNSGAQYDIAQLCADIHALLPAKGYIDHTKFELSAQLLEDALKENLQVYLAEILTGRISKGGLIRRDREIPTKDRRDYMVMASRLDYVMAVNFATTLSTNYSLEMCLCETDVADKDCRVCQNARTPLSEQNGVAVEPAYVDILRRKPGGKTGMYDRPIIQIHGSVTQPKTIVLSREGYRKLLHDRPNYRDFLKCVMMSKTILYVGFSFTDDYLNEVRSDVMSAKKHSKETDTLAYAIINDKQASECEYYRDHEGVRILTWRSDKYGFGVMDRYLDSILRMTDMGAALSGAKVVLFMPPADDKDAHSVGAHERMLRMQLDLREVQESSPVYKWMPDDHFQKFRLIQAASLSEVETTLKLDDFLQSWVLIFADESWTSIPTLHRELVHFLWHQHAGLNTKMYPVNCIVWGDPKHMLPPQAANDTPLASPLPLKEQYEAHLHVRFCTTQDEVKAHLCGVGHTDSEMDGLVLLDDHTQLMDGEKLVDELRDANDNLYWWANDDFVL